MKAVFILAAVLLLSHQCVDARTYGLASGRQLMADASTADKATSTTDTVVEKKKKPVEVTSAKKKVTADKKKSTKVVDTATKVDNSKDTVANDQSKKDVSSVTPDKKQVQQPNGNQQTPVKTQDNTQDPPTPEQTCYLKCNDDQNTCNDDCSKKGWHQECYMGCSTTQQACIQGCPGSQNIATAKQPQTQQVQQQQQQQPAQGADKNGAGQTVQQPVDKKTEQQPAPGDVKKVEQPTAGDAKKAINSQVPKADAGKVETNKVVKTSPEVVEATIKAVQSVTTPM